MRIESPLTVCQQDALEYLRDFNRQQLTWLFEQLDPPEMSTFQGEFDAELLHQGSDTAFKLTQKIFQLRGPWTGKAFCPRGASEGVGYNCFDYGDEVIGKLPMRTMIGDSRLDNRQSMIISYQDMNRGPIRWLVGELRQYVPTVILGYGVFGPSWRKAKSLCRRIPFVLVGPRREYRITAMRLRLEPPNSNRRETEMTAKPEAMQLRCGNGEPESVNQ